MDDVTVDLRLKSNFLVQLPCSLGITELINGQTLERCKPCTWYVLIENKTTTGGSLHYGAFWKSQTYSLNYHLLNHTLCSYNNTFYLGLPLNQLLSENVFGKASTCWTLFCKLQNHKSVIRNYLGWHYTIHINAWIYLLKMINEHKDNSCWHSTIYRSSLVNGIVGYSTRWQWHLKFKVHFKTYPTVRNRLNFA